MLRILLPFVLFVTTALAICECGYTVNRTDAEQYAVFTDLLEADFMHIDEVAWADAQSLGWIPQTYNQSTKEAGSYGMAKMAGNIMANPLPSIWDWGGTGVHRPDPGLELWVKNQLLDGEGDEQLVPTAELVSARDDIFYGNNSFL